MTITIFIIFAVLIFILGSTGKKSSRKRSGYYNKSNMPQLPGEIIWTDHGRQTKVFQHHGYQLLGKPDFIAKQGNKVTAIEFKSSRRMVYDSDIAQVLTAALCARACGHQITHVLVVTGSDQRQELALPNSDQALYGMIEPLVNLVKRAKNNQYVPFTDNPRKCARCSVRSACEMGR